MGDIEHALTLIRPLAPFFTKWPLEAVDEWLKEHSAESLTKLSSLTRDNYIYDQIISRAQTATLPVPIRVLKYGRMRWVVIDDGKNFSVSVWMKKLNPQSLLTSIYPTPTARLRQRTWTLWGEKRNVFFVCGHTVGEAVGGTDVWIDRIVLTQESRNREGVRCVTFRRPLYYRGTGPIALTIHDPQINLFTPARSIPTAPPAAPLVKPRVRPRMPKQKSSESRIPVVGTDVARREVKRAAEEAKKRQQNERGSQGA